MDTVTSESGFLPEVHIAERLTLPEPRSIMLPNGTALLYLDGGSQEVNQLSMCWRGGSSETPDVATLWLMDQLLPEGTRSMTGIEVSDRLDFYGSILNFNAEQHYNVMNLTSLNSKTASVLPVVRDVLAEPSFPEDTFITYRDRLARNLELMEKKVMYVAQRNLLPLICGDGHPLALRPTLQQIMDTGLDGIRDLWSRAFTPQACTAFLSGRLDDKVIDRVSDMLMSLPDRGAGVPLDIRPLRPAPPQTVQASIGAMQAAVAAAVPGPGRAHPDYVPLRFAVMALGGFFGSRLMRNIREDKGYTYGINASLIGCQDGSYAMIGASADPRYVEPLLDELRAELRRMATEPLDDDEMYRLRQHMSLTLMESLDTPFSIMDYYRTIISVGLPDGYFAAQEAMVRDITPAMIAEMSAKYLDPDRLRVSICL